MANGERINPSKGEGSVRDKDNVERGDIAFARKTEHVRDVSDRLLQELDELKALERHKRQHEISTPPFHELADAVADKSREIFATASEEQVTGDEIDVRQGLAIEEVQPSKEPWSTENRRKR